MYLQYIERRQHEVMIQFCINRLRPWVWDLSLVVLPTPCYYLVTRALCHIIKYIHPQMLFQDYYTKYSNIRCI